MLQKLKQCFYNTFPQFAPNEHREIKCTPPTIDTEKMEVVTKDEVDKKQDLYDRIEKSLDESLQREYETGVRIGDPFVTTSGPIDDKANEHKYNHARTKEGYGVCRCGTHENADEAVLPCPAPKPKNRNKKRKTRRSPRKNAKKNQQKG